MKSNYDRTIIALLNEIRNEARKMENKGRGRMIINRCDKLSATLRRVPANTILDGESAESMESREKSCDKIFLALVDGRRLSQLDCKEFRVEDMRTPVSHMRKRFHESGHRLESRWIKTATGRNIKEYWLERREEI